MSLVSNFIGEISSLQFGGNKSVSENFDLNDTTFAKLLEKQLENKITDECGININNLGIPAGMEIFPIEGIEFSETAFDQAEALGEKTEKGKETFIDSTDLKKNNDITTSEAVTFFSSLLENSLHQNNKDSNVFDFAKKQATNFYNKYSRNVITDVGEFVQDLKGML